MPNEPISAAPQPVTVPAQSLRSTHAPSTWPTNAEILAALGPWMLQRRWFPLKGDAAPPLGSLRVIASWEPEEGVRDLVIAALRGNQAETGHRDAMVLLHVPVVLEAAEALDSFATPGEAPGNHGLLVTTDSPGSPTQVALVDGAHHPAFWRAWALSALEAGTVLTISMTSGNMAQQLGPDERVVQVPIDVGAELARPGARVDIIGQVQEGWIPQATSQDDTQPSSTVPPEGSDAQAGTPAQNDPENSSTNAPTQAPDTPSLSPSDQEPPGIQKPPQSLSQGKSTGPFAQHSMVLCSGARVIMTQEAGESGRWTENKKVTLITLAIPAGSAILVVGAATNSTLGIALSP